MRSNAWKVLAVSALSVLGCLGNDVTHIPDPSTAQVDQPDENKAANPEVEIDSRKVREIAITHVTSKTDLTATELTADVTDSGKAWDVILWSQPRFPGGHFVLEIDYLGNVVWESSNLRGR